MKPLSSSTISSTTKDAHMKTKNNYSVIKALAMNARRVHTNRLLPAACCLLFAAFTACKSGKETEAAAQNGATGSVKTVVNTEKTVVNTEGHHEEETPTVAVLTDEQIKAVGIAYGTVQEKQLTATIKANGVLKVPNNNKANATSLYGGVIKSINVQVGSYVKKGQVIATIVNPQFIQLQEEYLQIKTQTGLGSAAATSIVTNPQYAGIQEELRSIDPKIKMAQLEVARQTELNEGNAGALKNLQQAKTDLAVLQARKAVLQTQLSAFGRTTSATALTRKKSIELQLRLMGINPGSVSNNNLRSSLAVTSPINGTISTVFSKIGSYVDVSSPVAEIVDNGQLHLDLNVFEKDLPLLKVGQTIHFTLTNNPDNEYDAEVYSIGSAFENESKTIPVHCTVKGNKTGLIDGMNITALVSLNNVTAPAVPTEAIVEADGKTYIFIQTDKQPAEAHEEGAGQDKAKSEKAAINFEKIEVVRGVSNMGYTAVTFISEIPQGVKIVVKGAFFINAKLSNTGGHED
jgi:membrane fusion protein, heavy metal efflux system